MTLKQPTGRNALPKEDKMATMLVQHKVKDFAAWKKVFDSVKDLRTSNGETSAALYQQDGDPNSLTLVFGWDSLENAKKYAHSPELKAAMEQAGVVGAPTISFLNEV
jgi:antibiotic biosynthesis monooxygenase (ABM) superfamily enzyme